MKALITASFDPRQLERLRSWMPAEYQDWRERGELYFDGTALAQRIQQVGADVLIVEADLVHDEVLDHTDLCLIACCRGDPINVALAKATALGIPVLYTPARNARAVAELTVAYMLALARHVFPVNQGLKSGTLRFAGSRDYLDAYNRYGGFELGSSTAGIIGFGAIGQRVARLLRGFETRVLAYDPYVADEAFANLGVERCASLGELLPQVTFLTLHCPLTSETFGLIGRRELGLLPRGAYLLNLARAQIVDEDALYDALTSGHLAGAALDVFSQEPVQPENRFVQLPNVLVSPHLGGATRNVIEYQSKVVVDDIGRWLSGQRPQFLANPEVWDSPQRKQPC
ncbi:MAG: D-3-phosphoglycerate dehydrogenase [Candidatus Binatia bacterium]|nr:MAG: D-3-phosphoglycerate dehydrogenase [Candidatus Binatia bacterium]